MKEKLKQMKLTKATPASSPLLEAASISGSPE